MVEDVGVAALARSLGQHGDRFDGPGQPLQFGGDHGGVSFVGGDQRPDDPRRFLAPAGLDGDRDGEEPGLVRASVGSHQVREVFDLDGALRIEPPPVVHGEAGVGQDRGAAQPPRHGDQRPGDRRRETRRRRVGGVHVGPGEEREQEHAPLHLGPIPERRRIELRKPGEVLSDAADEVAGGKVPGHLLPGFEPRRQAPERLVGREEAARSRDSAFRKQLVERFGRRHAGR